MTLAEVRAKLWRVIDDSREITNPDWAADARDVMIDAVKAIDEANPSTDLAPYLGLHTCAPVTREELLAHVKQEESRARAAGHNAGLIAATRILEELANGIRVGPGPGAAIRADYRAAMADGVRAIMAEVKP